MISLHVHIARDRDGPITPLCDDEITNSDVIVRCDIYEGCNRLISHSPIYACIPCRECKSHRFYDLKVLEFSL